MKKHHEILGVVHAARQRNGRVFNDKRKGGRRIKFSSFRIAIVRRVAKALRDAGFTPELHILSRNNLYPGCAGHYVCVSTVPGWKPVTPKRGA